MSGDLSYDAFDPVLNLVGVAKEKALQDARPSDGLSETVEPDGESEFLGVGDVDSNCECDCEADGDGDEREFLRSASKANTTLRLSTAYSCWRSGRDRLEDSRPSTPRACDSPMFESQHQRHRQQLHLQEHDTEKSVELELEDALRDPLDLTIQGVSLLRQAGGPGASQTGPEVAWWWGTGLTDSMNSFLCSLPVNGSVDEGSGGCGERGLAGGRDNVDRSRVGNASEAAGDDSVGEETLGRPDSPSEAWLLATPRPHSDANSPEPTHSMSMHSLPNDNPPVLTGELEIVNVYLVEYSLLKFFGGSQNQMKYIEFNSLV
ncbi:unnamed protein product [Protopolystoma xenopodis]|uniref:Uncharacterized protein n=1 Tax=Protopolystoma xenopodis TaxID=117903 RepID=A0A3S5BM67_9PLAT|nr:unnamed protein product [Protopolystoma xenopodis]